MTNYEVLSCPVCGGSSFESAAGNGLFPIISCENCGYTMELRIAMRRAIRCPVCGHRLLDAEDNVKTQVRPVEKDAKWKPDFYEKCVGCKSDIGIKKTAVIKKEPCPTKDAAG